MSSTTQLAASPAKINTRKVGRAVPRSCRSRHSSPLKNNLAALLLLLTSISGCKNRQVTTPTPQMDTKPKYWVRVLLLDDVTTCTLQTVSAFNIFNDQNDSQVQTAGTQFNLINLPVQIELIGGKITISGKNFVTDTIIISPDEPHVFNLNDNDYRGKLKLIVNPERTSFDVINLIPLEPYLAGVIGAEMPNYWEPEALKAQAIAARTYCLYIKNRFGSSRHWDVSKTAANQVYRGMSVESAQIWSIINQTKGQVLTCKQTDGTNDIFPSYYSSTCGGHTENSRNVFGDSFEPLTGVPCPYCKDVAKPKFFFWPMKLYETSDITSSLIQKYPKLKHLGEITNISAASQSDYGKFSRLTNIKLTGSTGKSDFLNAEYFRLTIDPTGLKFKSTICEISKWGDKWAILSGRGWGHGVGMCQCGAEGMARKGKTAEQILEYYYPNSKITLLDY